MAHTWRGSRVRSLAIIVIIIGRGTRGNNEGGVVVDEPLEGDVKGERERVSWPGKVIDRVSPEGRNEE